MWSRDLIAPQVPHRKEPPISGKLRGQSSRPFFVCAAKERTGDSDVSFEYAPDAGGSVRFAPPIPRGGEGDRFILPRRRGRCHAPDIFLQSDNVKCV